MISKIINALYCTKTNGIKNDELEDVFKKYFGTKEFHSLLRKYKKIESKKSATIKAISNVKSVLEADKETAINTKIIGKRKPYSYNSGVVIDDHDIIMIENLDGEPKFESNSVESKESTLLVLKESKDSSTNAKKESTSIDSNTNVFNDSTLDYTIESNVNVIEDFVVESSNNIKFFLLTSDYP